MMTSLTMMTLIGRCVAYKYKHEEVWLVVVCSNNRIPAYSTFIFTLLINPSTSHSKRPCLFLNVTAPETQQEYYRRNLTPADKNIPGAEKNLVEVKAYKKRHIDLRSQVKSHYSAVTCDNCSWVSTTAAIFVIFHLVFHANTFSVESVNTELFPCKRINVNGFMEKIAPSLKYNLPVLTNSLSVIYSTRPQSFLLTLVSSYLSRYWPLEARVNLF